MESNKNIKLIPLMQDNSFEGENIESTVHNKCTFLIKLFLGRMRNPYKWYCTRGKNLQPNYCENISVLLFLNITWCCWNSRVLCKNTRVKWVIRQGRSYMVVWYEYMGVIQFTGCGSYCEFWYFAIATQYGH